MKIKKIMAMLLAATMIMGSTITTFAAQGETPKDTDKAKVEVSNVDKGAIVKAYQIVDGVYNESGFVKYVAVDGVDIADPLKPTSDEVAEIAKKINNGDLSSLGSVDMTDLDENGTYDAELHPGYWVVLVRGENGSAKIYNPMLVSVWYSKSGSDNTMVSGSVSAGDDWSLGTDKAWAKSSEVTLTKTAKDSADFGEDVEYTLKAKVPAYGPEYIAPIFSITDEMGQGELELVKDSIQVYHTEAKEENKVADANFTLTGNVDESNTFTVEFKSDWIKANGNKDVVITYNAKVLEDNVNKDSHDNTATLKYSNNPSTTDTKTASQKVYSFDIGGEATGTNGLITKKGEGVDKDKLAGAEFTLYTDDQCKNQYVNAHHKAGEATAISNSEGNIYITGLEAGTNGAVVSYYLKETKAPEGYSLNDTVFKIDISANIENEELKSWNITISDQNGNEVENNFIVTLDGVENEHKGDGFEIFNTKLSSLPSTGGIGTTIFTIGGCAIMVAAAGLFFASRRKANK